MSSPVSKGTPISDLAAFAVEVERDFCGGYYMTVVDVKVARELERKLAELTNGK